MICVMFTGAGIDAGAGAAMRREKLPRLRLSQNVELMREKEIKEENECEGFSIAEMQGAKKTGREREMCKL